MSDFTSYHGLIEKAYKKLKSNAYYDKTNLSLRDRIARAESSNPQEIENRLQKLSQAFLDSIEWEKLESDILDTISCYGLPKKVKPLNSEIDKSQGTLLISGISSKPVEVEELQYFIDMDLDGFILGVLWIMMIGWKLDKSYTHCYGNRIHKTLYNEFSNTPTFSPSLFEPYYQNYESWRDQALTLAQQQIHQSDVLIFTLDFKRYYYSVDISEEFMNQLLQSVSSESIYNAELLYRINQFVYKVIHKYSIVYREYISSVSNAIPEETEPRNILPIGFLPSAILANECLKKFDTAILNGWNPLYYGRYVDDILIVEKIEKGSAIAQKAQDRSLTFTDAFEYYTVHNSRWNGLDEIGGTAIFQKGDSNSHSYQVLPKFTEPLGKATKIQLQEEKVKLFYFQCSQLDALITCFKNNIAKNKSEFRWMPEDNAVFQEDDYSEIFELNQHGANKLREIDGISIDKYALSKYLGKFQRITGLITEENSIASQKFIQDIRKIFDPITIIENYTLWERVLTILIVKKSYQALKEFVDAVFETIQKTRFTPKSDSSCTGSSDALTRSLENHLISSLARPMALLNIGGNIDQYFSLNSNTTRDIFTAAQKLSKHYFYSRMFDKTLCAIWPELLMDKISVEEDVYDLTDPDAVLHSISLSAPAEGTVNFVDKLKDIHLHGYRYYPYLIKLSELLLARLLYNLAYSNDIGKSDQIRKIEPLCWELNYCPHSKRTDYNSNSQETDCHSSGSTINIKDFHDHEAIQVGTHNFSTIRIAVASIELDDKNFDRLYLKRPNRSYRRYQQIAESVNVAIKEKADMLVLPEACTPREWLPTLARTCEKNHIAIVTGIEHFLIGAKVYNLTAVILPYEEPLTGQWHSVILYHSKNHFAPHEIEIIENYHLQPMEAAPPAKYELYSWNNFWFTVYCCFELTSIKDRSIFQSYVDAIIAVEWNQDINYYSNIIESLSRDIHCYCIQVNTSKFGDSRITKPSKTELKDILRIKGGTNATALVGTIDLDQLRDFQMKKYGAQQLDKSFKPTPPDFDYQNAYNRKMNTLFDHLESSN